MGLIILLIDTKFGPFCVALLSSRGIVDLPPTVAVDCFHKFLYSPLLPAFALEKQQVGKYLEEAKNLIRPRCGRQCPLLTSQLPPHCLGVTGRGSTEQEGKENQNILCPPLRGGTSEPSRRGQVFLNNKFIAENV